MKTRSISSSSPAVESHQKRPPTQASMTDSYGSCTPLSSSSLVSQSHPEVATSAKRAAQVNRPPPPSLLGGISSTFVVPVPQIAFENFTSVDLRAPFKWASKRKEKRKLKAKNDGKLAAPNQRRNFSTLVSNWMQRAKKRDVDTGLTVIRKRKGALVQSKRMLRKGKGCTWKGFLKSFVTHRSSNSRSLSKRDDRKLQPSNIRSINHSFTETFNLTDEDCTTSSAGFKSARSDFSIKSTSCKPLSITDTGLIRDQELEVDQSRLGKWGYWNNPDYIMNQSQKEQGVVKKALQRAGSGRSLGYLKFMCVSNCPLQGYSKLGKMKRAQKVSAHVCHVANELELLQLEHKEKFSGRETMKEPTAEERKSQSSVNAFCDKEEDEKSPGCIKLRNLTRPSGAKLGVKHSQIKQLSAPEPKGYGDESDSVIHILQLKSDMHKGKHEETKRNKAPDLTKSQLIKQLVSISRTKRDHSSKIGHDIEGVKMGSIKLGRDRELVAPSSGALPAAQMISPGSSRCSSADFAASIDGAGNINIVSKYNKLHPVDLDKGFSRLSRNDYIPLKEIACANSNFKGELNAEPPETSTGLQVLSIATSCNQSRSAVTIKASPRYGADLASLNARIDMRFEQVLKTIDIVADQVKRNVHSQQKTDFVVDDEEESVHSRLLSSCTSELGTVETELPSLKSCMSRYQLGEVPIIKEFTLAIDDARLKIRVLAGLLTVEKDAKMASARDFQSKRMILTMTMIGCHMLEGDHVLLEKPWHIKYLLDYCVSSIFFKGPHSSFHCICNRPSSTHNHHASFTFDSFCNNIDFASLTFDSFCDDAMQAIEELVGSKANGWSDALTNMFWNCAVCCFQVHKLIVDIGKCKKKVRILHPYRETSFDVSAMDPLDTGDFKSFHKKVLFTIFSGFMVEGTMLCKSQVYMEPKVPDIRL